MGIDTLTGEGGKGLKVTDLTVPVEQRTHHAVFDPERDVSLEDWDRLRQNIASLPHDGMYLGDLTYILFSILPVFPKARDYLDPEGKFFDILHNHVQMPSGEYNVNEIYNLALLKLSYPDRPFDLPPVLSGGVLPLQTFFAQGYAAISKTDWGSFLKATFEQAVLFPEKVTSPLVSLEQKEKILNHLISERRFDSRLGLEDLALFRIFCSEQRESMNIDKAIEQANTIVRRGFTEGNPLFLHDFFGLTVLCADIAQIDRSGLLVFKKELTLHEKQPAVPEVKKF